jgi:hypothetical protein
VIHLSQWFIMVCLWLYCISITKKSDTSITVIYHGMSLTVLYQYHQEEWYVYHSDLSRYVSDCTVSVSLRRVIRIWSGLYHCRQWQCRHTNNNRLRNVHFYISLRIQYNQRHSMINHCDGRITLLSDTDTVQSET